MTYALARPRRMDDFLSTETYGPTGVDLRKVFRDLRHSHDHYYSPTALSRSREAVEATFRTLARAWTEETRYLSSLTAITAHPAYRQIIRLGHAVVPLILREMAARPAHWFAALSEITGVDPVRPEDYGDVPAMMKSWLDWAEQNNIDW